MKSGTVAETKKKKNYVTVFCLNFFFWYKAKDGNGWKKDEKTGDSTEIQISFDLLWGGSGVTVYFVVPY